MGSEQDRKRGSKALEDTDEVFDRPVKQTETGEEAIIITQEVNGRSEQQPKVGASAAPGHSVQSPMVRGNTIIANLTVNELNKLI